MKNQKEQIISYLKSQYKIHFIDIHKIKGSYKLVDIYGIEYALKVVRYSEPHFRFILHSIIHLKKNNFNNVISIIKTSCGNTYIKFNGYYAYLTKWIESRVANYSDINEVLNIVDTVAHMHIKSREFIIDNKMEPRIGWMSWIKVFTDRKNEILDFKKRILQKSYKSKFDLFYLKNIDLEIEIAEKSIHGLQNSNYFKVMEKHLKRLEFCHHDLANHNVLISNSSEIFLIDFDYCILDTHLHDLSSIIIRVMKNGKWNNELFFKIIDKYSTVYPIYDDEIEIMKYFIMFPQEFWQVGLQKYWEQLPYSEERYENRIEKCINDEYPKQIFISNF